jgi:hypothetical protein
MRGAAGTIAVGALVALVLANSTDAAAQQGRAMAMLAQDPACTTPKVASAGGPMPKGSNTVVLRWLGVSNYELSYTGRFNTTLQNTESIPIVETFKPRIVLPSHHEDETGIGAHYDMPIYPLGIAVRDKFPDAQTIDPLYLLALCFDTHSKEFFVGR